ncbi:MAG: hypothetical protein OXO54_06685 [Chloroflexota bacterium]|nr:hypothetical protein [Chloroflexota bacterium]
MSDHFGCLSRVVPEVGEVWSPGSALGFGQRPVSVEGDGVAVVGGVGRAGDKEDAGGPVAVSGELEGVAGEGDNGLARGGLDFVG